MNWGQNSKQILAGLTMGFLVVTGTYNAVVINSESSITGSEVRFAKRLDEVYGVVKAGREVAATIKWQKLSTKQAAVLKAKPVQLPAPAPQNFSATSSQEAPVEVVAQAAVQDDLNLNLTEVINPRKWQQGLTTAQFSGGLATSGGVIESLNVSLPNGEGLSVSFSEMTGNVFEYDFEGELYSGMMYQVDQNSYIVTLTNGPLEGTRLKFTGEASLEHQLQMEDSQRELAENNDAQAGGYQDAPAAPVEVAQAPEMQNESAQPEMLPPPMDAEAQQMQDIYSQEQGILEQQQAQSFNFDQQQAM